MHVNVVYSMKSVDISSCSFLYLNRGDINKHFQLDYITLVGFGHSVTVLHYLVPYSVSERQVISSRLVPRILPQSSLMPMLFALIVLIFAPHFKFDNVLNRLVRVVTFMFVLYIYIYIYIYHPYPTFAS